ncbi:MAG: response regulator [Alphaproteobacteria bacterium]|nr:response regulator [Alphaproteobacteria bacterium]
MRKNAKTLDCAYNSWQKIPIGKQQPRIITMSSQTASRNKLRLNKVNILVIDDDKAIANLIRNVLKNLGFGGIFVAHDAEEGIKIVEKSPIDLIITDWEMEPINGIELTKRVRALDNIKRFTPIIMLTGHGEKSEIEMARDCGITEYLIKPFTAKSLCSRISTVVEMPRSFVVSKAYKGPSRRRRVENFGGEERRKRRATQK